MSTSMYSPSSSTSNQTSTSCLDACSEGVLPSPAVGVASFCADEEVISPSPETASAGADEDAGADLTGCEMGNDGGSIMPLGGCRKVEEPLLIDEFETSVGDPGRGEAPEETAEHVEVLLPEDN